MYCMFVKTFVVTFVVLKISSSAPTITSSAFNYGTSMLGTSLVSCQDPSEAERREGTSRFSAPPRGGPPRNTKRGVAFSETLI